MNCLKLIKDFNMLVDHMKCKCIFINTSVYFARYTVLIIGNARDGVFSFEKYLHHILLPIN